MLEYNISIGLKGLISHGDVSMMKTASVKMHALGKFYLNQLQFDKIRLWCYKYS